MSDASKPTVIPDGEYEWSNREYHARKDILGHSLAIQVLTNTDLMGWILTHEQEPEAALIQGSIWHSYMLEDGKDIAVLDYPDFRTKEAREARDQATAEGKYALLSKDVGELKQAKEMLLSDPDCRALLTHPSGRAERSFVITPDIGGLKKPVQVKARPDWLIVDGNQVICVDYKTTVSSSPRAFRKQAGKFAYFAQDAWYRTVLAQQFNTDFWDIDFVFLAQSKTEPYIPRLYRLDHDAILAGQDWMREALTRWAEHGGGDPAGWPMVGHGVTEISIPEWDTYIPQED